MKFSRIVSSSLSLSAPQRISIIQQQVVNSKSVLLHRCCSQPTSSAASYSTEGKSETFCASLSHNDLLEKLKKCQIDLFRHKLASPEHNLIKQQISKLRQEILRVDEIKHANPSEDNAINFSTMVLAPHQVTLEVISNGTTHLRPSVVLRTPLRCYLFNCPEGITRFISTFRIRANAINDIFATRGNWENTGGVAAVLLEKVNSTENLRLHGPHRIKKYLEGQRPFLDVDFGHVNYPVTCEELTYEQGHFEDSALHVQYIPLVEQSSSFSRTTPPPSAAAAAASPNWPSSSSSPTSSRSPSPTTTNVPSSSSTSVPPPNLHIHNAHLKKVDVAYLVRIKETAPSIDPFKLISLKIPKGPHIAKLKSGIPITLEDGRVIQPSEVYTDTVITEVPNLLFVELVSGDKLGRIHASAHLKAFMGAGRTQQMHYIVHFSRPQVLNSVDYRSWMRSFGPKCRHLVLNGTGQPMTLNDGIYKAQQLMNTVFPQAHPQIYPPPEHFDGNVFTQNIDVDDSIAEQPPFPDGTGPIFFGKLFQRFPLRGPLPKFSTDDPNMMKLDFSVTELDQRLELQPALAPKLEAFRKTLDAALAARTVPADPYPQITFLGTASAMASKYRNVSCHLLQLGPSSTVMIDCGEGAYGQLRTMFGPERCAQMLTNLNAIFITHSHLDHTNGVFTIVKERIRAFSDLGVPYRPLILACNNAIRKTIRIFANCYQSIDRFVQLVDVPYVYVQDTVGINHKAMNSLPSPGAVNELTKRFPKPMFSPTEWNLRSVTAVQVLHTRSASAFVFECEDTGRRVVFSGDTKPCALLEEHGRDADILVHECTFEDGLELDASRKRHSTMRQAFDSAKRMRAKHVFLTHFSTRYARCPPLPDYLLGAGNFGVANDFMVVPYDLRNLFPKMLPLFRDLFKEELFMNHIKSLKRRLVSKQEITEHQKQRQQIRR